MAQDLNMVNRVRRALAHYVVEERSMFGSIGFMVNNKLCICVKSNEVLYKLGPEDFKEAMTLDGCRPMIQKSRISKSWVFVSSAKLQKQSELKSWINKALSFNELNEDRKFSNR